MRALLIGGSTAEADRLARRLRPGALVICFTSDRGAADALKRTIASYVQDARVTVMVGDPALLIHKVAGPFDLIVAAAGAGARQRDRLRALLRADGELDD